MPTNEEKQKGSYVVRELRPLIEDVSRAEYFHEHDGSKERAELEKSIARLCDKFETLEGYYAN